MCTDHSQWYSYAKFVEWKLERQVEEMQELVAAVDAYFEGDKIPTMQIVDAMRTCRIPYSNTEN